MLMFCKPLSLGPCIVNKPYYYIENMYGGDLVKVEIKNLNPQLINLIFANMRAMLLWIIFSLKNMFGTRRSTIFKLEKKLTKTWRMNTM
jgi:hypothetical protein